MNDPRSRRQGNADQPAEGLYEHVVTPALLDRLARTRELQARFGAVDSADQPDVLTRHIQGALRRALHATHDTDTRLGLVADLLERLEQPDEIPTADPDDPESRPPRQLLALSRPSGPGRQAMRTDVRPATPLSEAALLTNAVGDPQLGPELRKEIETADGVDLLCAFVRWYGLRVLETELAQAARRDVPIRVITTTYLGSTERQALDRLARDFGAHIRVQYDANRTRLHAKAWLFRRRSGLDTAYVGSSNLSRAALLDGAEWNVRLSAAATPTLLSKFEATFEAYWHGDGYERYDPDLDRDRLDDALARARGGGSTRAGAITGQGRELALSGLEVRPYPHQRAILAALDAERTAHDRHRNLVVAATGTGKTVVAALDYARFDRRAAGSRRGSDNDGVVRAATGARPTLLFVAHRREILEQSLRTYREVLGDATFGRLYVDGTRPDRWDHVFATVQSLHSYGVANVPPDAFDIVVVDEFHHAEAPTYRALLDRLTPRELLGLTATPERADGVDVRAFFDGRAAYDLRLWDAIEADLLCPFQYFGIADGTDLQRVAWRSGRYDERELDDVFTGNDARARLVVTQVRDKIAQPERMRALGFCVSVRHAEYMTSVFTTAGLDARTVAGHTKLSERQDTISALRRGEIQAIFTVDVFNEGLDVPDVDTVLFLRPTDSVTVFLQQLGRGLRVTPDKAVLTVLDFVGSHRAEFRLDTRFRALTRATRGQLVRQVEAGFPFLPSGCQIVLDRHTQDAVLRSVREHLRLRWPHLAAELRAHPTSRIAEFIEATGLELPDVIQQKRSFTTLRRAAGQLAGEASELETALAKRVRAVAHVDDPGRAVAYQRLLSANAIDSVAPVASHLVLDQWYESMLYFTLYPTGGHSSYADGLAAARSESVVAEELADVIGMAFDQTRRVTTPLPGPLATLPLQVHASYQREEVLAALGRASLNRPPGHFREGVFAVDGPAGLIDAFFITLRKSEADYSPTTRYADYPISPTLFHWESQSTTSVTSPTGRRYLTGGSTPLLFVRTERKNEFGTAPYVCLGPARYESHTGDRPIAITWRLATAMPPDLYAESAVAM